MRGLFVVLSLLILQACSTPEQEAERVDATLESVLSRGRPVNIEEADALYEDGRYEAAATKYAAVVHADPKNHLAAYRLGESLLNLHRPKESVGFFTAAKASPDLTAQALQGIGLAFIQLGDPAILKCVTTSPSPDSREMRIASSRASNTPRSSLRICVE